MKSPMKKRHGRVRTILTPIFCCGHCEVQLKRRQGHGRAGLLSSKIRNQGPTSSLLAEGNTRAVVKRVPGDWHPYRDQRTGGIAGLLLCAFTCHFVQEQPQEPACDSENLPDTLRRQWLVYPRFQSPMSICVETSRVPGFQFPEQLRKASVISGSKK